MLHYAQNLNPIVRAGEYTRSALTLMKYPAETLGSDGSWGECDDAFVAAAVAKLSGLDWGRAGQLMLGPAECFIVLQWLGGQRMSSKVGSHHELRWSNGDTMPPTWHSTPMDYMGVPLWTEATPDALRPKVVRCWHSSQEYAGQPWGSLFGAQAQAVCEQLLVMQMAELTAEKSRLSNGVWYVPTEVVGTLRMMSYNGQLVEDTAIRERLQRQTLDPIDDPLDPAAVVPLILYGPAAAGVGLKHMTFEKHSNPEAFARKRDTLIAELAMLLPVPESVLIGIADANHWDAKLADDNDIKFNWTPAGQEIADSVTDQFLRPYLDYCRRLGAWTGDPHRFRIGTNAAALAERPADTAALTGLWDRGLISGSWTRRKLNVPESAKPTAAERLEWREARSLEQRNPEAMAKNGPPTPLAPEVAPGDYRRALPAGVTKGVTSAATPRQVPAGTPHDGAMIAVMIPPAVASRLVLPGGEPAVDLHCTLVAFEQGTTLAELMPVLQALDLPTAPLTGQVGGLGMFPPGDDGLVPLWATVDVPFLAELRQQIVDALGVAGIPFLANHGWTPHVTLAYTEIGAPIPAPLPPSTLSFGGVCATDGTARWEFPFIPVPARNTAQPVAAVIDVASTVKRPEAVYAALTLIAAPVRAAKARQAIHAELAQFAHTLNAIDNDARTSLLSLADTTLAACLRSVGREVIRTADRAKAGERDPWRSAIAAVAPKGTDMVWALDTPGGVVAALGVDKLVPDRITIAFRQFGIAAARILATAGERAAQVWTKLGITASVDQGRQREAADRLKADMEALALARVNSTEHGGDARAVTPMQLIGAAVAIAGGWQVSTSPGNVLAPGQPVTGRMAAGIAWPVELVDAVEAAFEERLAVEKVRVGTEWTWFHDHPVNPFEPHVALHGVTASSDPDFGGYWPGDHPNCLCHIEPSLILIPTD